MPGADTPHKMWGGRFRQPPDSDLLEFASSFPTDRRLLRWDVVASIAHVQMLGATGIISASDAAVIADGLRGILADAEAGRVRVKGRYEDVHSFLEAILYRRIGPVAGRLHTARSRNDQVATALRLYVKEAILHLVAHTVDLMDATVGRAAGAVEIILPGFTHLQHAQPVRLAHHLLADAVTTGSSLMPQKKNPDPVELIRGRAGRAIGAVTALLTALKGLPSGYQRDLQEDKDIVFGAVDLVTASVRALQKFLTGVEFSKAHMEQATRRGLLTATEVADYLAGKGMPFREAHEVAGRVVQEALARGIQLWELPMEAYARITPLFGRDILEAVQPMAAVEAKRAPGGTARAAVEGQLHSARLQLDMLRMWVRETEGRLQKVSALADR